MSEHEKKVGQYAVEQTNVSVDVSIDSDEPEILPEPYRFPLLLIAISFVSWLAIAIGSAVITSPGEGFSVFLLLLVYGVVSTIVATASCFVVGRLFDSEFGEWKAAIVKLAATCVFPLTVAFGCLAYSALFGPRAASFGFWTGLIAVPTFTLTLLKSLFGLELFEMIAVMTVQLLVILACAQLLSLSLGVQLSP